MGSFDPKVIIESDAKRKYVKRMFDSIAAKYDFLNHLLSFGFDIYWRKFAVKKLNLRGGENIIDIACGTGDFSLSAYREKIVNITGVDVSLNMLKIFLKKAKKKNVENLSLVCAEAENLPFKDGAFDACLVAFGVRNFSNLKIGLREIFRILKDRGKLVILEFSLPKSPLKEIYLFYFRFILPLIGKLVSKHENAYRYLPESVLIFPQGENFALILKECGFRSVQMWRLTFGIVTLYLAEK